MRKGRIKILEERCKGCLLCIQECRVNEIIKVNKVNKYGYITVSFKDAGRCNGCTLCAIACPDCAIEVYEIIEEKE